MVSQIFSELASLVYGGWLWWWDGISENATVRATSTIFASILAISWYAWLAKKSSSKTMPPLPPGPLGIPFLGNLPFVEPDFHRYFSKLSQLYGPIFKLKLGSKMCIVVSSPSLAKQVLKDHDEIFANRDPPAAGLALTYGGQDIVWSPQGPEWRNLRKVFVREMMSNTSLDACCDLRRQEVHKMVREVYAKVGTPINIGEQMFFTGLNVIMNLLWGGTLHSDQDRSSVGAEFRQVVDEMIELAGRPNISDLFPLLAPFDLQGIESKAKKLLLWFDKIFESLIARRMRVESTIGESKSKGRKDFLQFLLELKQHGDEKTSLSLTQIKALFIDIIFGATDTSSTTVEWAMAELLQHPKIMKKVQEELDEVVGNNNIVEELHLPQLHYLDAVLRETFRLHPVIPLLVPHCPSKSCIINDHTIPKGAQIFLNVWAIQRDSEAWTNPLEFNPERFLGDMKGKYDYQGNNFNFLPFGSGRRICAGIPLGERMVMYVLASLLHAFKWELLEGTTKIDLSEKFRLVLKKKEPLFVIPMTGSTTIEHIYRAY